jgi:Zn-dependent M28 family amino/carboxypeptidase
MRSFFLVLVLLGGLGCSMKSHSPVSKITARGILDDVRWLASDELQGRHYRSKEAMIAAKYIADKWKEAGLVPLLGKSSMYIPTDDPRAAPNVAAMWRGNGDGYVLLTAHYDHLKPRMRGEDKIYNGADDNASGTAALIAIAQAIASQQESLPASIVFVAFTGEEAGFIGSEHFVQNPPFPLSNIRALINLDMISRGEPNTIFLEGAPDAPKIALAIHKANKQIGLTIIRDAHPDWLQRSDQAPFLDHGVPCVFLSVEDHEDYHRVTDHADRIIPELAAKTAQLAFLAAVDLAGGGVP